MRNILLSHTMLVIQTHRDGSGKASRTNESEFVKWAKKIAPLWSLSGDSRTYWVHPFIHNSLCKNNAIRSHKLLDFIPCPFKAPIQLETTSGLPFMEISSRQPWYNANLFVVLLTAFPMLDHFIFVISNPIVFISTDHTNPNISSSITPVFSWLISLHSCQKSHWSLPLIAP